MRLIAEKGIDAFKNIVDMDVHTRSDIERLVPGMGSRITPARFVALQDLLRNARR
jgi:hypothetical protein